MLYPKMSEYQEQHRAMISAPRAEYDALLDKAMHKDTPPGARTSTLLVMAMTILLDIREIGIAISGQLGSLESRDGLVVPDRPTLFIP